jgi:hypothetical protein
MKKSRGLSAICCAKSKSSYKAAMHARSLAFLGAAIMLSACGIGRVVTAPVRYVFHEPEPTPVATASDISNPGQPVAVPSPTPVKRTGSRKAAASAKATPRVAASKNKASLSPGTKPPQFPVAKPVPGKPGLVFSPFKPNGGYIDVSGYAPGSKVKDPDTQQIFVVP